MPTPPPPHRPVKIGQKKLAAEHSGLYFMFLAPPPPLKFLDPQMIGETQVEQHTVVYVMCGVKISIGTNGNVHAEHHVNNCVLFYLNLPVNLNPRLIHSKNLPMNDFALALPDPYTQSLLQLYTFLFNICYNNNNIHLYYFITIVVNIERQ